VPMVSGAERNASSEPDAASTTAFPLPAQSSRAVWMRDVSGGVDSSELENSREPGAASVASSVAQVPGNVGSVTVRWSPRLLAAAGPAGSAASVSSSEEKATGGMSRERVREGRMTANPYRR